MEGQMIAIGFLGAGNMAEAIIGGIIRKNLYSPSGIASYDINSQRMVRVESRFGLIVSASPHDLAKASRAVVIAMKPARCCLR